ncbi:unnamed protein product [Rhizoctonia solani]|uniref:Uncharacterized protein n=1 Tax=Rhizoctonia solani TaxID=456999 RepID=A0A8H3HBM5_9AGAM|nr:unnamed protein product [Rhizoctonia solani]
MATLVWLQVRRRSLISRFLAVVLSMLSQRAAIINPPQLPTYFSQYNLKPIVGKPTEVKIIHAAIRAVNGVAHLHGLYNPDLFMQLSQHLFNAQPAVCRADYFVNLLPGAKSTFTPPNLPSYVPGTLNKVIGVPSDYEIKSVQSAIRNVENLANTPPEIGQLKEAMREIKQVLNESKDVLEHMDRVLVSTQIFNSTVGAFTYSNHVHKNPVNDQGKLATECGLPQLRFYFYKGGYHILLNSQEIAGYLKFLGIGSKLLEGGREPKLKANKEAEAKRLLMKHIGIGHIDP